MSKTAPKPSFERPTFGVCNMQVTYVGTLSCNSLHLLHLLVHVWNKEQTFYCKRCTRFATKSAISKIRHLIFREDLFRLLFYVKRKTMQTVDYSQQRTD